MCEKDEMRTAKTKFEVPHLSMHRHSKLLQLVYQTITCGHHQSPTMEQYNSTRNI
jgi:hypothetical protein